MVSAVMCRIRANIAASYVAIAREDDSSLRRSLDSTRASSIAIFTPSPAYGGITCAASPINETLGFGSQC
jgi:hypothetical protein